MPRLLVSGLIGCLVCLAPRSYGDILHLRNGDRLHGVMRGEEAGDILLESSAVGELLRIPSEAVHYIEETPVPMTRAEAETERVAEVEEPAAGEGSERAEVIPENDVEASVEVAGSSPEPAGKLPAGTEAKAEARLPDNWTGQVQVGYNDRRGDAAHREMSGQGKLAWNGEKNELEWRGHYRYYQHDEEKSTDRYGAVQRFRHRGKEGFFVDALSKAEVDNVSKKRTELSQTAGLGYAPFHSDKFKVNITPGVKAEHITNAENPEQNGTAYKANVQQALEWKLTDDLAVGQSLSYSVDPSEDANWDADFNAYVETQMTDSTRMRLSYRRDVLNQTKGAKDKVESEIGASIVWDF